MDEKSMEEVRGMDSVDEEEQHDVSKEEQTSTTKEMEVRHDVIKDPITDQDMEEIPATQSAE
jgi:hypothetical protein